MVQNSRLTGEERRTAIVESVLPLFAKKGFHGVTTRELAEAAGVSEALLYKHFPSKETLYEEIQRQCGRVRETDPAFDRLREMPPGTEKLVAALHLFIHRIATRSDATFPRLVATSLLEDGRFARNFLKGILQRWSGLFSEALREARRSGDVEDVGADPSSILWLCHHLAMALIFLRLPGRPAVDYGVRHEEMVSQAIRFCLRGMGLRQKAIDRYCAPWQPEAADGGGQS